MVDVARGLATLPTRPPTPPKESLFEKTIKPVNDTNFINTITQRTALDTPDESPSSSADYFTNSSEKPLKRVGFSPWNKYHQPLSSANKATLPDEPVKPLPPSKDLKSLKSILKTYDRVVPADSNGTTLHAKADNFPAMLESVTQQLAGMSRSSRLDAYMTLIGCLKAYDNVPDPQAMAEKMDLLAQFIRRDICIQVPETGTPDSTLVTQALKLLTIFLGTPSLAESLPDDFCAFIVEKSILTLEEHDMPKMIVNHYMHLLATQKFRSKTMNNDRVNRLLTALDKVTDHVKGNGVVGQRLMIYQRLLTQARSLMVTRVGDWMDHLFSGMLSSTKDLRSRAIAFGIEAGLALGTTSPSSRAAMDVFNRELPEGTRFADLISKRLNSMVNTKDDGTHVPQIWSVMILFLRSRRHQLEHWEYMKTWLSIIQRCFNSSDTQVKFQAHVAWNRLIFAISPDTSTSPAMVTTLRQPIVSQLERKGSDKHAKQSKQITYASYCTLLYYALRPSATHAQLDSFWDAYVSRILPNCFLTNEADTDYACRILVALFGNTQPSVWNENRANENGPIKPDELPRLNPKWTRLRVATVLKVFETILRSADWQKRDERDAWVMQAWRSFVRAIADAGNKEVKVSMECMGAIAHILRVIKCFWVERNRQSGPDTMPDVPVYLHRIQLLINAAMDCLGPIPFTEKRLLQSPQDSFEAAETPSSRSHRHNGVLRSPVVCLVDFLRPSAEGGRLAVDAFKQIATDQLQASLAIASSRRSQLKALREWMLLISFDDTVYPQSNLVMWQLIAGCASASLTSGTIPENASDSPSLVAHEYKDVVKILEVGVKQQFEEIGTAWESLHQNLHCQVRQEIGNGATVLAVTEPLAGVLQQMKIDNNNSGLLLSCAASVVECVLWPENRQVVEHARKHLWGPGAVSHKSLSFDPFDHLYTLVNHFLIGAYTNFGSISSATMTRFISAVASLVSSCPLSLKAILLKRIQKALGVWIEDASRLLTPSTTNQQDLYQSVKQLWAVIVAAVDSLSRKDSTLLQILETLVVSSLRSRHKSILNESIALWNRSFGVAEQLEYSDSLRAALLKVRSVTEILIPGLSEEDDIEVQSTPFNLIESQEDESEALRPLICNDGVHRRPDTDAWKSVTPQKLTEAVAKILSPASGSTQKTTERGKDAKATPTRRLRHDDSQIQFAAIESSPLGSDGLDSQLLTDRQKEVTERQRLEAAAMFPHLGSSLRVKTHDTEGSLPRFFLSSNGRSFENMDVDDTASPTLQPVDALMNDFMPSSPSSRSSQKWSDALVHSEDPRSFPPAGKVQGELRSLDGPPSSPPGRHQRFDEPPVVEELRSIVMPKPQDHSNEKPDVDKGMQNPAPVPPPQHQPEVVPSGLHDATSSEVEVNCAVGENVASDLDIFVDANSSPVATSPLVSTNFREDSLDSSQMLKVPEEQDQTTHAAEHDETITKEPNPQTMGAALLQDDDRTASADQRDVSRIEDSFRAASPCSSLVQEKQISAQLVDDLGGGSSHAELSGRTSTEAENQNPKGKQKRKRASESPMGNSKKTKARSPQKSVQVVIERRETTSAEEELLDCIVVDTSAVKTRRHPLSQEIKPEQSYSPGRAPKFLTPTPRPPNTSARRERPSMAASGSTQEEQARISRKRKALQSSSPAAGREGNTHDPTAQTASKKRRSIRLSQASITSQEDDDSIASQKLDYGYASTKRSSKPLVLAGGEVDDDENDNEVIPAEEVDPKVHGQISGVASERSRPMSEPPAEDSNKAHERDETTAADADVEADAQTNTGPVVEDTDQREEEQIREGQRALAVNESEALPATAYDVSHKEAAEAETHSTTFYNGQGILTGLKQMLRDIQHVTLGQDEEREVTKALFELGNGVYKAGRRRR